MKKELTAAAWNALSESQRAAIGHKICQAGGEAEDGGLDVLNKILRGELGIELRDQLAKLFDVNGWFIPPSGFKGSLVNANGQFHFDQPLNIKGNAIVVALKKAYPGLKFSTGKDLDAAVAKLRPQIADNVQTSNLLKGVWLPLQLPKLQMADYGTTFEQILLPGVERAYQAAFPDRKFINYRKGELANQVKVVDPSHNQLIEMISDGPVNGLYFTNPLQGFGIEADREAIKHLLEGFSLTGAIEPAFGLAAFPKVLARDYYTPALDCAALSWRSSSSLNFRAHGNKLYFDSRSLGAYDNYSGGLFFVGQ